METGPFYAGCNLLVIFSENSQNFLLCKWKTALYTPAGRKTICIGLR